MVVANTCRYVYPTMDQLADTVSATVSYFGLRSVIGFGVGAGANVLARYAVSTVHYTQCKMDMWLSCVILKPTLPEYIVL